jgi:prophage regulatory protein
MRLLRIQEVISITGISRMTIYRLEKDGLFPGRRRLGKNSVAWLDEDITSWVAARPMLVRVPPDRPLTAPLRAPDRILPPSRQHVEPAVRNNLVR